MYCECIYVYTVYGCMYIYHILYIMCLYIYTYVIRICIYVYMHDSCVYDIHSVGSHSQLHQLPSKKQNRSPLQVIMICQHRNDPRSAPGPPV